MEELLKYTFEYLIQLALSMIPDTMDKRQGSIIYDALAPACYELAGFYLELYEAYNSVFIDTAEGEFLDRRAAERGITRKAATPAYKRLDLKDSEGKEMSAPIGSRFSAVNSDEMIIYATTAPYVEHEAEVPGAYVTVCETPGTIGNSYMGSMLPISNISGLGSAILSTLVTPGQDEEGDDEMRDRYKSNIMSLAYGGNRQDYINWVTGISGVGAVQVYPTWDGGGTVKVSVVTSEYAAAEEPFLEQIKTKLDPEPNEGDGDGLSPIGHTVTVVTATEVTVNVTAEVMLVPESSIETIQEAANEAVSAIIDEVKKTWGVWNRSTNYSVAIYTSRIITALMEKSEIINVQNVALNGVQNSLEFTETAEKQEIPKFGTLTLTKLDNAG